MMPAAVVVLCKSTSRRYFPELASIRQFDWRWSCSTIAAKDAGGGACNCRLVDAAGARLECVSVHWALSTSGTGRPLYQMNTRGKPLIETFGRAAGKRWIYSPKEQRVLSRAVSSMAGTAPWFWLGGLFIRVQMA